MPEVKEQSASYEAIKHNLEPRLNAKEDFHVRGIWADATILESEAQWPVGHPVRQGHIYKLGPNDPHEVLRGSSPKARTNISPTFPADATHAKLDHSQLDQLELKAVHNSSRAIVIDFGVAWLRVCLSILLHILL
jgi:hypothetical protein